MFSFEPRESEGHSAPQSLFTGPTDSVIPEHLRLQASGVAAVIKHAWPVVTVLYGALGTPADKAC